MYYTLNILMDYPGGQNPCMLLTIWNDKISKKKSILQYKAKENLKCVPLIGTTSALRSSKKRKKSYLTGRSDNSL